MSSRVLILGIGNVLMGDEGIGVHVVRYLEKLDLPGGVTCLDGGTGSFTLLEPMQQAEKIILIDATVDGAPGGAVRRIRPRYSKDYPRTLTAHDIGLKDLLDAFYLLGKQPDVTLFAIPIACPVDLQTSLSPELEAKIPEIAKMVLQEVHSFL